MQSQYEGGYKAQMQVAVVGVIFSDSFKECCSWLGRRQTWRMQDPGVLVQVPFSQGQRELHLLLLATALQPLRMA